MGRGGCGECDWDSDDDLDIEGFELRLGAAAAAAAACAAASRDEAYDVVIEALYELAADDVVVYDEGVGVVPRTVGTAA